MSSPIVTQRLGGAAMFVAATVAWFSSGFGWLPFVLLLFAFDLSMLGYLAGPRLGAAVYNLGHGLALPSLSAAIYLLSGSEFVLALSCLWFAHIGIDYALGYGLKRAEGFQSTHLGPIGKARTGDSLQGIKKGIVELAELVIVNKADGDMRAAAGRAAAEYRSALRMLRPLTENWKVPVLQVSSIEKQGLDDVWQVVLRHRETLGETGLSARRAEQAKAWMWSEIEEELRAAFVADT